MPAPPENELILVFDFGAQYAQLIARRVRECNVFCQLVRHDLSAERVKAFVPTWDLRRRAERVGIELPVQIEGHAGNTHGHTVDLSSVGARVATDERLTPGDMVVVTVTPEDTQGPMRIRAVVWEVDARGAVLVFANLAVPDFTRLRSYIDSLIAPRA